VARQHSSYRCHAIPFWWATVNRRRAMGASLGAIGTARAQHHLRQILVTLNLFTLNQPEVIIADAAHRFDENGNLIHEPTKQLIQKLLESLVDWTRRISPAPVRTINLIILSSLREAGTSPLSGDFCIRARRKSSCRSCSLTGAMTSPIDRPKAMRASPTRYIPVPLFDAVFDGGVCRSSKPRRRKVKQAQPSLNR
jgi:hypothetical protein